MAPRRINRSSCRMKIDGQFFNGRFPWNWWFRSFILHATYVSRVRKYKSRRVRKRARDLFQALPLRSRHAIAFIFISALHYVHIPFNKPAIRTPCFNLDGATLIQRFSPSSPFIPPDPDYPTCLELEQGFSTGSPYRYNSSQFYRQVDWSMLKVP